MNNKVFVLFCDREHSSHRFLRLYFEHRETTSFFILPSDSAGELLSTYFMSIENEIILSYWEDLDNFSGFVFLRKSITWDCPRPVIVLLARLCLAQRFLE